jgi:glucose-6-phosphate 1-dehydrogenase
MRPLKRGDLVRGQYAGYRREPGVARHSDVETFCALRLFIDSWRWEGAPWYPRSGKYLPETATEVIVKLKAPPQRIFAASVSLTASTNYLRFRLSPSSAIALAARVKRAGQEFVGDQRELYLSDVQHGEEAPYERLLGAAWREMWRCLPARTLWRLLGRSSIPCSSATAPPARIGVTAGAPQGLTR